MNDESNPEDGEKLFISGNESAKNKRTNGHKNGSASINIENIKTTFTGMSKEELMKFANDPFWIRIRWFLFISFWIIWGLMLFAAVYIIITTPKCEEPPSKTWWEVSPIFEIDVANLRNLQTSYENKSASDILRSKIDDLKKLNVKTVLLKSVLLSAGSDDDILDYKKVNNFVGSVETFKDVISYAESIGIFVLLSFTPNNCNNQSMMFARSVLKEDYYKEFFVWKSAKGPSDKVNNWLSVYNESAWEWNAERHQFYLHQFKKSQPDFNFRNLDVINYFLDVLEYWMSVGVKGFYLDKTEYLVEDDHFANESLSMKPGYTHDQYGFYAHTHTVDLLETTEIIKQLTEKVHNHSGVIGVSGGVGDNDSLVNYVIRPIILTPNFTAEQLNSSVSSWLKHFKWPAWKFGCASEEYEKCFPEESFDGLMMISFILPGSPVTYLGQEYGLSPEYPHTYHEYNLVNSSAEQSPKLSSLMDGAKEEDSQENHVEIYTRLSELRKTPSLVYGDHKIKVLSETVFCVARTKSGNPGYLAVWNVSAKNVSQVDLTQIESVPNELTVITKSSPHFGSSLPLKSKVYGLLDIPAHAGIVFSFVPHQQ